MNEYTASNGQVIRSNEAGVYVDHGGAGLRIFPTDVDALREYFAHEAKKRPWHEAAYGDVWLFHNKTDRQRALAWRAAGNWDVIDPRGNFHSAIDDIPEAMTNQSFEGWEDPTAELVYRTSKEES